MHHIDIVLVISFVLVMRLGIVRAEAERFPRHAAQASRPLPRSRKAVLMPGLIPRRATSRMASMPLVCGLGWYPSSLASRVRGEGRLLLGLASTVDVVVDLHASCQLSAFELVDNFTLIASKYKKTLLGKFEGCQDSARTLATQARPRAAANRLLLMQKHSFKKGHARRKRPSTSKKPQCPDW